MTTLLEEISVKKLSVCILFGGISPEHEVSLRSAESVLNNLDQDKYNIFPVGITKEGDWILYGGTDYAKLPTGEWRDHRYRGRLHQDLLRHLLQHQ